MPLKKLRVTRGKFVSTNKTFKIIDDWSVRANAHRLLEGAWIGTTDFRESYEFIDDDSDEELKGAEQVAEDKESGEVAKAATPIGGEEDGVEYYDLSTPEKSDPVCRQLFSAAVARRAIPPLSGSLQGHESEGECKAGIASQACTCTVSPVDGRREQQTDAPAPAYQVSRESVGPRRAF